MYIHKLLILRKDEFFLFMKVRRKPEKMYAECSFGRMNLK